MESPSSNVGFPSPLSIEMGIRPDMEDCSTEALQQVLEGDMTHEIEELAQGDQEGMTDC